MVAVAHDVILRGADGNATPALVQRSDDHFVDATLQALADSGGASDTLAPWAPESSADATQAVRLYQPIHNTFNLAVCEALCDVFGEPRLAAEKIDSAGYVIRRVAITDPADRKQRKRVFQGWMTSDNTLRGWLPFAEDSDADLDPDPTLRHEPFHAGQAEMKRLLALLVPKAPPLSESTTGLFVAPPEICQAAKRTLLYGLVTVGGGETSEASPQLADRASDDDYEQLIASLALVYLQQHDDPLYIGGIEADDRMLSRQDVQGPDAPSGQVLYAQFLRTLRVVLDVLGDSPESQALYAAIDQLKVYDDGGPSDPGRSAAAHVAEAIAVLVLGGDGAVRIPQSWGPVTPAQAAALQQALGNALRQRSQAVLPAEQRYDDPQALYHLRAFVRVLRDDGCPPELVWSAPSREFSVVPWFDNGKGPPVQVTLPDISDFGKLKPNVAFKMPGALFKTMQGLKAKDLLDGKGSQDDDLVDWICSFNIPIITLCAFIVLNLFLSLLDIVFWWMAYIKICIPIPKIPRKP